MKSKWIKAVCLFFIILLNINYSVFAFGINDVVPNTASPEVENIGNQIVTIISTIASIISVIVLIVLGIKYMMGSVEEKAEYKKAFIPYIIGAFLLFTITLLPQFIYTFMQKFNQ